MADDPTGVISGFRFCGRKRRAALPKTFFAICHRPNPRRRAGIDCLLGSTWSTRASRAKKTIGAGSMLWSAHHSAAQAQQPKRSWPKGLRNGGRNTPDHRKCLRQAVQHLRSVAGAPSGAGRPASSLQRGWLCTTSASGSTISSAVPVWPLPICWMVISTHTKLVIGRQRTNIDRNCGIPPASLVTAYVRAFLAVSLPINHSS